MIVKLLSEHFLEFLRLKVGRTGSYESKLVKMPSCWKSHVTVRMDIKDSDQTEPMSRLIWAFS